MKTVRVYRHPDCARCARYARMHHALDWLGRVETSTETPPAFPALRMGQVVVEDLRTRRIHEGADAAALLLAQVPAYWPIWALRRVPAVRRRFEREFAGACTDDASCAV